MMHSDAPAGEFVLLLQSSSWSYCTVFTVCKNTAAASDGITPDVKGYSI